MNLIEIMPHPRALSRGFLVITAILLIFLAVKNRKQVKDKVNEFFTESAHPLNLAVFRIVMFLAVIKFTNVSQIIWFSQMPEQLQFLPGNLGWLFEYLPLNPETAKVAIILLFICCFTGAIGLFSRTSALLVAILGFYVLGISQLWGKVGHNNHLIWFVAILAVSRCGDFFSVDAVIAAWKKTDKGIIDPPNSSRIYALPLRFVWLLFGVIYFFPGFWKFWRSGYQWFWSDNIAFQMYKRWLEFDGGWIPIFRIDQYPFLIRTSGLWTIVWEMSFIFLLFLPKWRPFAVFMGLFFHNMTSLFMRISFSKLQVCYVAFFNWYKIFHYLGGWIFPQPMYVFYNENSLFSRRIIASVQVFDIFGRITYVNIINNKTPKGLDIDLSKVNASSSVLHTIVGKKSRRGFAAYRLLSSRIPILWLLLPLVSLCQINKIGNIFYRSIATSSVDNIGDTSLINKNVIKDKYNKKTEFKKIVTVGALFLFLSTFYGMKMETAAWPFSCYPTFSWRQAPQHDYLKIVPLNSSGDTIPFNITTIKKYFPPARFDSLARKLIKIDEPNERDIRLKAFWKLSVRYDPNLQEAVTVKFYKEKLWISPEKQQENPISKKLYHEFKL